MIGLEQNTVKLVDHDAGWARLGRESCRAVQNACGKRLVDVQHVGSTAVPGLEAKPILDLAAGVHAMNSISEISERLTRAGYLYRGDQGDDGGHLFVLESSPGIRTVHLHVVEHGGNQWRDYLRFRDLLRDRPAIRERYSVLKRGLASACRGDRALYTASKAEFIREILGTL